MHAINVFAQKRFVCAKWCYTTCTYRSSYSCTSCIAHIRVIMALLVYSLWFGAPGAAEAASMQRGILHRTFGYAMYSNIREFVVAY